MKQLIIILLALFSPYVFKGNISNPDFAYSSFTDREVKIEILYKIGMTTFSFQDVSIKYRYSARTKNAGFGNVSKVDSDGYSIASSNVIIESFPVGADVSYEVKVKGQYYYSTLEIDSSTPFTFNVDSGTGQKVIKLIYVVNNNIGWTVED